MTDRVAARGFRLGTSPGFEDDHAGVAYEPRTAHTYVCVLGHQTSVPFHVDAEVPMTWGCATCPAEARLLGSSVPAPAEDTAAGAVNTKSHWEQLMSRRTEEELETLLQEALTNYRKYGKAF